MPPLSCSGGVAPVPPPVAGRFRRMHPPRTHAFRHGFIAVLAFALAVGGGAGCGDGQSTSDAKIVSALELEQANRAYRMGGDPFCTIDELLNDGDEVDQASDETGRDFLIASPDGEIGVLARRPFAPDCTQQAKDALRRLAKNSE
jgi:hypothetical protein